MNRIWIKWMKRTIQLHSVAVKSIYISFNISFWTSWYCAMISKEYSLSISLNGFTAIKTFDMYSWRKKKKLYIESYIVLLWILKYPHIYLIIHIFSFQFFNQFSLTLSVHFLQFFGDFLYWRSNANKLYD